MNLFLCRDDTYKFSFPERHWIPWPILSFPVKEHSLISLQALGSMMASALSCTVKAKCTKLNPNDTENTSCIFFLNSFYIITIQSFQRFFKILKRMQICELLC